MAKSDKDTDVCKLIKLIQQEMIQYEKIREKYGNEFAETINIKQLIQTHFKSSIRSCNNTKNKLNQRKELRV